MKKILFIFIFIIGVAYPQAQTLSAQFNINTDTTFGWRNIVTGKVLIHGRANENWVGSYYKLRFKNIYFDEYNSLRNDGTPTSILWADNTGHIKRSPTNWYTQAQADARYILMTDTIPGKIMTTYAAMTAINDLDADINTKQDILSGTGIVKSTAGSITYITDNSGNWNTAFGWGNHAGLYPTYTGVGATGTWGINVTGNAATVTDGIYSTGSYNNPAWITGLSWSKIGSTPTTLSGYGIADAYPLSGNPSGFLVSSALTPYLTSSAASSTYQPILVSGTTLKTVGGQSLLGSGNISVGSGTVTSVGATAGTGISVSGSPVTTSGSITITNTAPDQTVVLTGAGTNSVTGTYPNFTITGNIPSQTNFTSYAAGTGYNLTTTSAKVTFGTTSPSVTLTASGTYLILVNTKVDFAGVTSLLATTANLKLRRTNNTASDLTNASTTINIPVITLLTLPLGDVDIPAIIYTTSTTGDIIELWGNTGPSISVGNIRVNEASIVAVKLY